MAKDIKQEIILSVRRLVALQLWDLGAVKVNLDNPFKLVSGNYSPIYVNCRLLISSPAFVDLYCGAVRVLCDANDIHFDVIAGGETAGIPFAAMLARAFGKPMIYVRKAVKGHGLGSLIEGDLRQGARVLLAEDLITDAGSKLSFIDAIKNVGSTVDAVVVVFDRLQGGREALEAINISLLSITDMQITLDAAGAAGVIKPQELVSVRKYLESPRDWHRERNLAFSN